MNRMILVKKLLENDERQIGEETNEEEEESPVLLFHDLTEKEWQEKRYAFSVCLLLKRYDIECFSE